MKHHVQIWIGVGDSTVRAVILYLLLFTCSQLAFVFCIVPGAGLFVRLPFYCMHNLRLDTSCMVTFSPNAITWY